MPKPRPEWSYTNTPKSFIPPSESLIQKIKVILNLVDIDDEKITSAISQSFALYQVMKSHTSGSPTNGQLIAASQAIIRDVDSLLIKIDGEMGCVAAWYKYSLPKNSEWREIRQISPLLDELATLKNCCVQAIEDCENRSSLTVADGELSPKLFFIQDIAYFFRVVFKVKPSIYISDEHENKSSQYAKVLSACFQEIDGNVPRNLKTLMSQEKKIWEMNQIK